MKRTVAYKYSPFFNATFPIRLHVRNDLHLVRKIWHMVMGLIIAFLYLLAVPSNTAVLILGSVLVFDLSLEATRLRVPSLNERILKFWGPFMRTSEVSRFSAVPHYLLATILTIGIFPKPVAVLSILYLACGDPIASFFGILYGHKSKRLPGGKSLIGTAAGVVTCMALTFIFLKTLSLPDRTILALSVIGGLAGGTAELAPIDIDDNFTIPVISGFVLWLAFILLGV